MSTDFQKAREDLGRRLRVLRIECPHGRLTGTALRLAMVGAGVVDDELDDAFRAALGIGLAR
ncbi:hypothetical protein ACZ90_04395, partial [Streptomyces albus subsp. albus]